ncbi:MAG: flagellar export protein FliJ [Gammaproteobacteria bacterium]|nr:flagellar export protein FliJ [Gammaproteobacteria bacterium]
MKASQRLKPVQRLNDFHEQNAARELGGHTRKLDAHRKRLEDLNLYQIEYGRNFLNQGQAGMSASKLQDYQAFMANLTRAIEQQRLIIKQFEAENERLKRQWMATHQRSKAVDSVVDKLVVQESYAEDKRTQKELDDRGNSVKNQLK